MSQYIKDNGTWVKIGGVEKYPADFGTRAEFEAKKDDLPVGTVFTTTDEFEDIIDDDTTSASTTWSSQKINDSLVDIDTNLGELIKTKVIALPYSNFGNGESKVYNLYNYGIEMEGYTPIGIIGFRAENVGIVPAHMTISNDAYGVIIRNISGATASDSCSVTVLYVKKF